MRDHELITIEEFNGLWRRGDFHSTPRDHFTDCVNIQFAQSSVEVRAPILKKLSFLRNVVRAYIFVKSASNQQIIALDDTGIYWAIPLVGTGLVTPISAALAGVTDFAFVNFNGRGYISHIGTFPFILSVYLGDYSLIQNAAGAGPGAGMVAANSATAGNVEAGFHYFSVAFETNTGYITGYSAFTSVTAPGNKKVDLTAIPVGGSNVVARHIVATKIVFPPIAPGINYQTFFVPNGRINDNTSTTLTVNFYDIELLDDSSYLADLVDQIPAGTGLSIYHNRLLAYGDPANPNNVLVSNPNDPETIDSVDGLLIVDTSNQTSSVTNSLEYRDVLYLFKLNKTYQSVDNGDVPSSWNVTDFDDGIGTTNFGIALILDDHGGRTVDGALILDRSGIYYFDGAYRRPEVTWKLSDLFGKQLGLTAATASKFQLTHDPIAKRIYLIIPSGTTHTIYMCDYSNTTFGSPDFFMKVKWAPWTSTSVNPKQILIWDDGESSINKFVVNDIQPNFYGFEDKGLGNGKFLGITGENRPEPFIQTAFINDNDGDFIHFGGINTVVSGVSWPAPNTPPDSQQGSIIKTEWIKKGLTQIIRLANFRVNELPNRATFLPGNAAADYFLLKFTAIDPYNQYFNFNRIHILVKKLWAGIHDTYTVAPQTLPTIVDIPEADITSTGDFTPFIDSSNGLGSIVYSVQKGKWFKVGNMVYVEGTVTFDTTSMTGSGTLVIRSLPFPTKNTTNLLYSAIIDAWANLATNWSWIGGNALPNTSKIKLVGRQAAGVSVIDLAKADINVPFTNISFSFSMFYESEV